ncbi:pyrroline-5-carboxylate reductase [Coriobacterium glomerans]|uniref:pyrroline-5-carboxylate reductase n=1 Tax=Coriobacterium glomerans TaxID=33871 RepID=UPI001FDF09B4|nr:pyrroline-5-carboxylate reductase [Coriobacterium glomerans]
MGFIGFGNMGRAMAEGLIRTEAISAGRLYACASDYQRLAERAESVGIRPRKDVASLVNSVDMIVVAVKPHVVEQVLVPVAKQLVGKPIISIAAGWSCADLERILPGTNHLSSMPNMPVAVNEGVIICEGEHTLTERQDKLARSVLSLLGSVEDVDSSLLAAAGTVSGCSPAFVAMMIEALGDAAVKHGVPREMAYRITSQTFAGTARLQLESGRHPAIMKDAVCSPGGSTIKGVSALEAAGIRSALIRAIDAIEA